MARPAASQSRPPATANAPTETEAPEQQQPEAGGVAGAVAAATVAAALLAGNGKTLPKPPTDDLVKLAAARLLAAMDTVFRERRVQFATYITQTAEQQMPGVAPERVGQLAAEEMARESEFQRKARMRLEKDLPVALREPDPGKRAEAVGRLLEREKRYLVQREQAAAQRLVAALEADLLRQASPHGALWQLSPLVRNHCLRCIAMSGKFWPWEVLETYRLPVHPNCACRLLSLDEATSSKLMSPADIPDTAEAISYAKTLWEQAGKLEESMTVGEQQALVTELKLEVAEASLRELLRWSKGTTHGGEFRPKSGGNPGAAVRKDIAHFKAMLEGANPGAGRSVQLLGKHTFVPLDENWSHVHGKVNYSSPHGSTALYRNGVLMHSGHKDLGGEHSFPAPPPEYEFTPDPDSAPPIEDGPWVIPDYSHTPLEMGKSAGGSNGAKWAFDAKGDRWLVKAYRGNQDRVATELLANAVYRELGANVPTAGSYIGKDKAGKPVTALAYPTLPGETRRISEPSAALGEHFMADALLANWDVVGAIDDNVLWEADGKPVRVDQGGTLQFRAQGAPKPFGPVPSEAWTMMSHGGQGFDKMAVSEAQMREQARTISERLTPQRIGELVASAPFRDKRMRREVQQALNDRVQWMHDFAEGDEGLPKPLAGSQVGVHLGKAQRRLEPSPEQIAGLHTFANDEGLKARMQQGIREGRKLTPTLNHMRLGMDDLIRRSRTPEDLTLYRTINPAQLGDLEKLPGKVLRDKGYGVATSSRAAAREAPGMLHLHVPAGANAVHLPSIEGVTADQHHEVVLARGAGMRVKAVEQRAGRTIVHAVVLP